MKNRIVFTTSKLLFISGLIKDNWILISDAAFLNVFEGQRNGTGGKTLDMYMIDPS